MEKKTFIQKAYEKLRFAKTGDITLMVGISRSTDKQGIYLVYTGDERIIPLAKVLTSGDCQDVNPLVQASQGVKSMLELANDIDGRSINELDKSDKKLSKLFGKGAVLLDAVIKAEKETNKEIN